MNKLTDKQLIVLSVSLAAVGFIVSFFDSETAIIHARYIGYMFYAMAIMFLAMFGIRIFKDEEPQSNTPKQNKNMTICKVCGKEIAKNAKACPHCGGVPKREILRQGTQGLSGYILFRLIGAVTLLVICSMVLIGINSNHSSNVNNYETAESNQYYIEIVKSRLGKDFANNDVLIVRYKFMHTYDEPKAFGYVFDDKIYQNGIECKSTYWKSQEITEDYKYSEIQPNTVVEFETTYGLNDLYSPVDVQITKMFSKTVVFSQTINLK